MVITNSLDHVPCNNMTCLQINSFLFRSSRVLGDDMVRAPMLTLIQFCFLDRTRSYFIKYPLVVSDVVGRWEIKRDSIYPSARKVQLSICSHRQIWNVLLVDRSRNWCLWQCSVTVVGCVGQKSALTQKSAQQIALCSQNYTLLTGE